MPSHDFNIIFGSGFHILPGKGKPNQEIERSLKYGNLLLDDLGKKELQNLLENSENQFGKTFFSANGNSASENETRKLIVNLCQNEKRDEAAKKLALNLSKSMDKRTKEILFLTLLTQHQKEFTAYLLTLDKTNTFSAKTENEQMKLTYGEGFPQEYFKIAVFRGNPLEKNSFMEMDVADYQNTQKVKPAANYWTKDFLQSEPEMTPAYATNSIMTAVKKIYQKAESSEKESILRAIDDNALMTMSKTPTQLIEKIMPTVELIEKTKKETRLTAAQMQTPIQLDKLTAQRLFEIKTIIIDGEITVRGPKDIIDTKVKTALLPDNRSQITIVGKNIEHKYGSKGKR